MRARIAKQGRQKKMKIAVTAQGQDSGSQVDPRFGRAMYFIVIDSDSGQCTAHSNELNVNAAQGAGIQAARAVAQLGVAAVLTGNVGPKAFAALQAAGIQVYLGASGTVAEAVAQWKAGSLQPAGKPNVEGHWG